MKLNGARWPKKVRSATDFNLEDLGVSNQTQVRLGGIDEKELLYQIRVFNPRVRGVPQDCYREIKDVAESEGFIRHDFDERTFGLLRLYGKVLHCHNEENLVRSVCDFRSNDDYENFQNFSREKIGAIRDFLKSELTEQEYEILQLRYGFGDDATPKDCTKIAKMLGIKYAEVNRICTSAETVLSYPSRASVFRTFMYMGN